MNGKTEKSFKEFISNYPSSLGGILKKLESIQKLNEILYRYLSPELQQQCQVANLRENRLILRITNASWATRLRFQLPVLTQQLTKHPEFNDVKTIDYYIDPPLYSPPLQWSYLSLSKKNAELILQAAESIEDEKLKAALKKLGGNGD